MNHIVVGNRIRVNGREVIFDHPIKESLETDSMVVVVLESPHSECGRDNVYGVSKKGVITWRIDTQEKFGSGATDFFTGILGEKDGIVYLSHYSCDVVMIDPKTGAVIGSEFRR